MKMFVLRVMLLAVLPAILAADEQAAGNKEEWQVEQACGPARQVEFTTDEGTWMNLDVSPDGQSIVFDLLGDIYIMPISGGTATCIAEGLPLEVQPRFSPDGKSILFTSDRGGGDNIWMMNTDGTNKTPITKEDFRLCNNAVWMPDGNYIVAKKHFTSTRSLGAGEMWMYHISGGSGVRLTERKNDQQDVGEPCVSPDGRYVYFSEDMSPGGYFQYNKDPNKQIYVIRRVSLADGKVENVVSGPGGAVRPQISPDGELLAFVRRVRTKSVLYIHKLSTGEEWPLYDSLSKDQQETWATFGVYPNYSWTPDGKGIVLWAQGRIHMLELADRSVRNIPFEVQVRQTLVDALRFEQEPAPEHFSVKMIRQAVTSPDGRLLAFNAVGSVWLKELPNGKPQRLSPGPAFEFQPAFSPDGSMLLCVSWQDSAKGSVVLYNLKDRSRRRLTDQPGFYHGPQFSPDGAKVVYQKSTGDDILGMVYGKQPGLYWLRTQGSAAHFICREGHSPRFSADGERVRYLVQSGKKNLLKSVNLHGGDEQTHCSSVYATEIVPSPDDKWIAFTELFNTYIAAFPASGAELELSAGMKSVPVFQVSRDAGTYVHWSGGGSRLHWTLGPEYFSRDVKDCFAFLPNAPDEIMPPDSSGIPIGLSLNSDKPAGKVALVGARIITMKGDELIENGSIVVEGNRIIAIGRAADITIPADAARIDVQGKTIMPGLIDVHAHLGNSWTGISPQQQWSYWISLAYGVTTTHDPSSNTEMVFSQAEMVRAGIMVGPRIFSTGTILYGAEGDFKAVVNSLDDARKHLRRMKAVGAFSVKSYNQPRRNQRQQVLTAAREENMLVVPEGGSFFYHNLTMIQDGHTGVEHVLPVAPLYRDVVQLWSYSKTAYTPTLIVGYGGLFGENYFYQHSNVWEKERLLRYTPRALVDSRSRRRMLVPEEDYGHFENARSCKAVHDAGVNVQLGAHGQLHGLDAHWELWLIAQGGFTPLEALRIATLEGAQYIGMDKHLGSLEVGKLADLIVLDENPLEDIRNTEFVRYTMINGRIYDAESMREVGNYANAPEKFYWQYARGSDAFEWFEESESFMRNKCGCCGFGAN